LKTETNLKIEIMKNEIKYTIEEYNNHDMDEQRFVVVDSDGMMISSEHMDFIDATIELNSLIDSQI
jgi:hypothetical protein